MKKDLLIYQIALGSFMLSFSSCINQDFDIDDDKLDKNVTIGNSINLPIGDIEKISVYDQIKELYKDLEVDDNGTLYIEYGGTFPVKFPKFEIPSITTTERLLAIKNVSGTTVTIPSVSLGKEEITQKLVTDTIKNLAIDTKLSDNELTFEPKKIGFEAFTLKIGLHLLDVTLTDGISDNAEVIVDFIFPENYNFRGVTSNEIQMVVPFKEVSKAGEVYYPLAGRIEVESYELGGEEGIDYTVTLKIKTRDAIEYIYFEQEPKFYLSIDTDPNPPTLSYLECSIHGTKEFTGEEKGFAELQDVFGANDSLQFKNPSLSLELTTNLGTDFNLGLKLSRDVGSENEIVASLTDKLPFVKSTDGLAKTETYDLSPTNLVNFDKMISTPFPQSLGYTVQLIFNDDEAKLPPTDDLELSANYSFKIPFDFNNIDLSLNDTITNLFSEDTYEQVFSYTDNVIIEADNVGVNIGVDKNGKSNIELEIIANILDANSERIDIKLGKDEDKVKEGKGYYVLKNGKLSITIEGGNKLMKDARDLEFTFRLHGSGAIKNTDSIEIKGLRLRSDNGIHYEF
jgi:hypothetical protein